MYHAMEMEGRFKSYVKYSNFESDEALTTPCSAALIRSNQALTTPSPYKVSKPISFESWQKAHELRQSQERLLSDSHMSALKTQPRQMGHASTCFSPGDHQPDCNNELTI
jgi:hypothetical protein